MALLSVCSLIFFKVYTTSLDGDIDARVLEDIRMLRGNIRKSKPVVPCGLCGDDVEDTRCIQCEDIRRQLNLFLKGTSAGGHVNHEVLSSSALYLLRTVPVSRHAVLEHYGIFFGDAMNIYLSYADQRGYNGQDADCAQSGQLAALQDVTGVLLSFIKSSPEAWAPVVSSWALSVLGQISWKYTTKRGIQHATSLNEVLHMWMTCPPTKMLIEITTECFAAMVGGAPDICVDALLEASVRYSPHFDWVVAHIGSCFPRTIITRVLNCGLKDFCSSGMETPDKDASGTGGTKVPKMASVVVILGHLASKHGQDIRKALMSLFKASLLSDGQGKKVTTLPFLLQLASMSDMLLQILTTDLVSILTPDVLNQVHRQFIHWKHASPSEYNSFLNLVVHLMSKSNGGALEIVNFIISTAVPQECTSSERPVEEVRETCVEIMHILMFELQRGVLSRKPDGTVGETPLLTGLSTQTERLTSTLLNSEGKRVTWLQKLLTFTALQTGDNCAASILSDIVFQAQGSLQLGLFYKLKQDIELGIPNIMQKTLVYVFNKLESLSTSSSSVSPNSLSQTQIALKNLERIVSVEKIKINKKCISHSTVIEGLRQRHSVLCDFMLSCHPPVCMSALGLMASVGFPKDLSVSLRSRLCGAMIVSFFETLHRRSEKGAHLDSMKSAKMTHLCMSCIEQLSDLPFSRSLLIHYLMDGAVQKENIHLLGGKCSRTASSSSSNTVKDNVLLIEENRQQSLSIALPRFHSSVYHGGVIRRSHGAHTFGKSLPKELVTRNCLMFTEALWLCCREKKLKTPSSSGQQLPEGSKSEPMETDQPSFKPSDSSVIGEGPARTLGCSVVDILTLDSLYNDVHWQDPDFRKVTTERDTLVWKRLEELPVLLNVIQEFSSSSVFVYYLSPVLRALMAVVMNHLEVARDARMVNCPKYHEVAVKLVNSLNKGSMIVPPLSNVAELFPFVSPYEGYLLLLALWRYIKENPPSEFESEMKRRVCDSSHMFVVNSIIHANIDFIGHLCPRIFNM